jgi:hypothetical protein
MEIREKYDGNCVEIMWKLRRNNVEIVWRLLCGVWMVLVFGWEQSDDER